MNHLNLNIETVYPGAEMLPAERLKLFQWITEIIKPANDVLEIGCGVGGSTYYISESINSISSSSIIHACDPDRKPTDQFLQNHTNVKYKQIYSNELISEIINDNVQLDYLFFDGPEDPNIALNDIQKLEKYIKPGCYFSMHDWEIEKRKYDNATSTKAKYIRPYIEQNPCWELIEYMEGINSNESVGICLYKFLGK